MKSEFNKKTHEVVPSSTKKEKMTAVATLITRATVVDADIPQVQAIIHEEVSQTIAKVVTK